MPALLTVRECVGQAAMEIGIAQTYPQTVVGTLDQDVAQMLSLLYLVADEVMDEEPYKETLGDGVWVFDGDGSPKPRITADDDRIAFDGRLAINGVKFRFLKAKGLEFGEEMRDFTTRLNKLGARANARVLDLDTDGGRVQ